MSGHCCSRLEVFVVLSFRWLNLQGFENLEGFLMLSATPQKSLPFASRLLITTKKY
ncbi:MAG: hypothetical protein GDA51_13470 [Ekhidna sp.]|nr:hypothetical protein [Ekhidna sp.]